MAQISLTTEEIVRTRAGRTSKPNEFSEHIEAFNDNMTRKLMAGEGEKASTLLAKLRQAANAAGYGVKVQLIGGDTPKDATGFLFKIGPKAAPRRKATTAEVPDVIATQATKQTKSKGAK